MYMHKEREFPAATRERAALNHFILAFNGSHLLFIHCSKSTVSASVEELVSAPWLRLSEEMSCGMDRTWPPHPSMSAGVCVHTNIHEHTSTHTNTHTHTTLTPVPASGSKVR